MWCRRALDLTKDKRFKYVMLFRNYGKAAGASLEHPHTQIVASTNDINENVKTCGADGYLIKPFNQEQLTAELKKFLG